MWECRGKYRHPPGRLVPPTASPSTSTRRLGIAAVSSTPDLFGGEAITALAKVRDRVRRALLEHSDDLEPAARPEGRTCSSQRGAGPVTIDSAIEGMLSVFGLYLSH
jgi:hypothetical protein